MNLIKKIKAKFQSQPTIFHTFEEAANNTYKIMDSLVMAISAFCNGDVKGIEDQAHLSLQADLQLHKNYYEIVEKIYSRKIMTFSREDRQYIISQLLEIADFANFVIRRIKVHHPGINESVSNILLSGIPVLRQSGKLIRDLVIHLLYDFSKAKQTIWDLHHLQRELWDYELQFLKALYNSHLSPENIIYYEIIMRNLKKIIIIIVRFSDRARELILKYTL